MSVWLLVVFVLAGFALAYLAGYDQGRWVEGRRHGDAWTYPPREAPSATQAQEGTDG